MTSRNLKSRIQRLERQLRTEGSDTIADQRLRLRLEAALRRVAKNRENEAGQKREEAA